MNITDEAIRLYTPPFRYSDGNIFDSAYNLISDNNGLEDDICHNLALRVRGWGRIFYSETRHNNKEISEEVGRLMAAALTTYWESIQKK